MVSSPKSRKPRPYLTLVTPADDDGPKVSRTGWLAAEVDEQTPRRIVTCWWCGADFTQPTLGTLRNHRTDCKEPTS